MEHIAKPECAMRLDRYLRSFFPGIPQSIIEKSIRKGLITINKIKCLAKSTITGGEIINLPQIFTSQSYASITEKKPISAVVENLSKKLFNKLVVHEDEQILVINKPAKLATQGGSKISISIDDAIKYHNTVYNTQMKIVHRLDKDTTGLLLIAKNRLAASQIALAFKNQAITKKYLALFFGTPKSMQGWIKSEIDQSEAISHYKVVKRIANQLWCILFTPKTGKMHQIRKHALLIGGAIVGDSKYNDNPKSPYAENLMLHASYTILPNTISNLTKTRLHIPIPQYWNEFLSNYVQNRALRITK